jgi:LysR family transcriptional regulator, transcription activator of glutamate synthase operon
VDTNVLRWFQQVADGYTVTEVSEVENVTQSGVSRGLARLEAELGTELLRRSGRTLRPTLAGSRFKKHVDALLHQLDDGLAAVEQVIDPETGTVHLAFQISLGTWLVPKLLSSFRAHHPGVKFGLTQVRDDLVDSVLDRGLADLVLSTVRPADRTARRQHLLDEPLQLAVPAGHRLAATHQVRLADAATEPFLMLPATSLLRTSCDQLCRAAGFEPTVSFEGEDLQTLRGFVAAGLGISVLPSSGDNSSATAASSIRYLEITDVYASREIGLAWAADHKLLPAADLFRRHVIAQSQSRELRA